MNRHSECMNFSHSEQPLNYCVTALTDPRLLFNLTEFTYIPTSYVVSSPNAVRYVFILLFSVYLHLLIFNWQRLFSDSLSCELSPRILSPCFVCMGNAKHQLEMEDSIYFPRTIPEYLRNADTILRFHKKMVDSLVI
jgi:hypothetical protein